MGPGVEQVRRFNRIVTQRVGVLDDAFLQRDRPIGQARLLWEIGPAGSDVRSLRARLDLDSGYLSRLLRALDDDGLVAVVPSDGDGRVRTVRLTRRGLSERAELDRRSDALAASILEPLDEGEQARLLTAMAEVERLLTASAIEIGPRRPTDPGSRWCLESYVAEIGRRFPGGFDEAANPVEPHELSPPAGLLLVAALHGEPVACGGLKLAGGGPAEIKRLWVAPEVRGLGLGRRLLGELERHAAGADAASVRLDTNGSLTEAITLYRSSGYREIPPFNDNPYAHHWFEKDLTGSRRATRRDRRPSSEASDPDGMVGPVSQSAGSARLRSPSGARQRPPGGTGAGGQSGG